MYKSKYTPVPHFLWIFTHLRDIYPHEQKLKTCVQGTRFMLNILKSLTKTSHLQSCYITLAFRYSIIVAVLLLPYGGNMLKLFDTTPIFLFTTREAKREY